MCVCVCCGAGAQHSNWCLVAVARETLEQQQNHRATRLHLPDLLFSAPGDTKPTECNSVPLAFCFQCLSWVDGQEPKKLEDLTGLTELMNSAAMAAAEFDKEGSSDFGTDDGDFVSL